MADQKLKQDAGKLRFDLIPPEVDEELAKVLTYGAEKYAEDSWQGVEDKRYVAALYRHLNKWRKGEKYDDESNIRHLTHALCNVAFLLWKEINNE